MFDTPSLLVGVLALIAGGALSYFVVSSSARKDQVNLDAEQRRLRDELEVERRRLETEARATAQRIEDEARARVDGEKKRLDELEERLRKKEDELYEARADADDAAEQAKKKSAENDETRASLESERNEIQTKLEGIAKLSRDEARQQLFDEVRRESIDDLAKIAHETEAEQKKIAEEEARNMIAGAVHRVASEVTRESTVTTVELPGDEYKGRIIGKEGRNIVSLERATGVDIIIDDSPGVILVSGFDLVRRYVAKLAIEELIEDGRVHPARIEEIVKQKQERVEEMIENFGKKAMAEIGVAGWPPEIISLLGRLRFRTSYGQNVLKHSLECARIAVLLAAELGVDPDLARRAALLHDIGKALTADQASAGGHAMLGHDILEKHNFPPELVHAVGAHHEDLPMESALDFIICAADKISAARPGARSEATQDYIQRMEELEKIATGKKGVAKAYAIQAGREIRILVNPDKVDDLAMNKLGVAVAREISEKLSFPGEIRVTVIRENRSVEYAR